LLRLIADSSCLKPEACWLNADGQSLTAELPIAYPALQEQSVTSTRGKIVIQGQKPLSGHVRVSGSKNAADSAFAACLLTGDECVLDNVPDIEDVRMMGQILGTLGARVDREGASTWRIRCDNIDRYDAPNELVSNQRASFQVMGPLLGRFGEAACCSPGG